MILNSIEYGGNINNKIIFIITFYGYLYVRIGI